jgi:hypothetical protein
MNITCYCQLARLALILFVLYTPGLLHSQQITLLGNVKFYVANSQPLQAPDGFVVKDNATNILPPTLMLSDGGCAARRCHGTVQGAQCAGLGQCCISTPPFPLDARPATDRDAAVSVATRR